MSFGIAVPLLLSNSPALAEDTQHRFDRWERRLRAKITELHVVPALPDAPCDVTVSFAIGKDGRPTDATVRKSSCKPFYERAARQLVSRIGKIGKVPSASGTNHSVVLQLSYGVALNKAADHDLSASLEAERETSRRRNLQLITAGS